jgi:hypothetical protein
MTPAEKAKQLVHKFYFSLPNNGGQTGLCNIHQRWDEGKICARIAADEIIDALDQSLIDADIEWWKQVKQEIEKL